MVLKAEIRSQMLQKRRGLDAKAQEAAAFKLHEILREQLWPSDAIIAGYWPVNGEIDVRPFLQYWCEKGGAVALPAVTAGTKLLQFRHCELPFTRKGQCEKGAYGIMQPVSTQPQALPDIVLVPLVACDMQQNRMGYGGGYYDTTLAALRAINPHLQAIGCAYHFQQMQRLPIEPHDERLDAGVVV